MIWTKKTLAKVLNEDNIKSYPPSAIVNYSIIALIILTVIQIILEADASFTAYYHYLEYIDVITIAVFTVEYFLRMWVSGEIHPAYKGTFGKVKYFFSFYALIDFIAIAPYYVSLLTGGMSLGVFKVLRVLRVLRLARFLSSFDFIAKATKNKRSELLISMQVVLLVTFVLSVLLFHVENKVQPENFSSVWDALLWSCSKYIGDIGGYGSFTPISLLGKILATIVGLLGIAIFAIPAGIIASGFVEEIEKKKEFDEIEHRVKLIESSFILRKKNKILGVKLNIRFRTLPMLQSRLSYTDNEIFEAVRNSDYLRIKWDKSEPSLKTFDMIVLENYTLNRSYGEQISTDSNIHILNPSGRGERAISHFTKSTALYGQFNYMTNEIFASGEVLPETKFGFDVNPAYSDPDKPRPQGFDDFCSDIKESVKADDWVIIVRAAASKRDNQFHVLFGGEKGDDSWAKVANPTIDQKELFEKFLAKLTEDLTLDGSKIGTHEDYDNVSPNLLHQYVRKETGANVITLFISIAKIVDKNDPYYALVKSIGDCLKVVDSN
jgi:voltage-gated potassium channel